MMPTQSAMMNETEFRRILPDQSSGSGHTFSTPRTSRIIDPILSKRVCFYKSGDSQFNGLRMVINNRTFKTFDALLDSLSKKVPLPFGVRNITTPRGVHAVHTLDELVDGKSYICSDSRKVKPINLALARKKLPPWYNARPVSSRRRTVQLGRSFPGQNMFVRTPKRLLIFRNGDPTVKHTVVLHKRTTLTFESILEHISELIQFQVLKLHTADGRRVDSIPGLILCSGTVVAVGREPFRHANYNAQKSPAPTMLPTKRMGHRRLKALKRKKKSLSYTSQSRNFSPSSERYIVNRIHNSIAGSSCDLPSHSVEVELESGRMLESVPETPDTCLGVGAEEQESLLPSDDDIEKSFRVNQDGSMTVEMKVRLTIKEEETIHWTTTLSRSSVANQLNGTCLPEPEAEQEISSLKLNSLDLQSPAASIDTINKTKDNNDEDPPSLGNRAFSESSHEEDNIKVQTDVVSPRRAPTPGHKQITKKQVESLKSVTAEGIQEGTIGSYSYRERTENGAMTEQYCMVKQSSSIPVPKPRNLGSVDAKNINRNVSTFKSAGMAEIQQIESSGEEVTETVLHVYEQQTYLCSQGVSASEMHFCRPATSETGQLSSSNEFEPQLWRPSTASESISIWRTESMSVTPDFTLPSLRTGAIQATNAQQQFPKPTKGKDKPQQREVNKDKRLSPKPKAINKRVQRLMSPGKRQKESSAGATKKSKKVKTFSSAGFIKKIYGNKSKSAKRVMKLKKVPTQNDRGVTTKSSQLSKDTIQCILKDPSIPSALKETMSETVPFEKICLNVAPNDVSQPRGILTRQTSMHQEIKNEKECCEISKNMPLPAFNSSSFVTNEYVENWLEKAHLNPTAYPDEESKKLEAVVLVQTESDSRCGESENKNGFIIVAQEVKCLDYTSEIQSLKTDLLPENELGASVKQKIQSFENKSPSPSMEKTPVNQQIANNQTNTENYSSLAQNNIEEIKPLSTHNCSEKIPPTNEMATEMPSDSEIENKSNPIKMSFQEATPSNTLSMDLPPPPSPPPAENTELSNTEYCRMDAFSVVSSPLYRLSSVSSQTSDNNPLSISPTSDKAISPTDHRMEMTTSIQTDIPSTQRKATLPRAPSIKRAPLVSNISFDRKMSLRKACLDKYTLCSDETSTSSTPVNIVGDNVLPNSICSTGTQWPSEIPPEETQQSNGIFNLKSSPSCCTSATSLTTEERIPPVSISSSEAPTPSDLSFRKTEMDRTPFLTQKEESPKLLVKKLMSSPSPERKSQTKKFSSELSHNSPKLSSLHNLLPDKTMSPNIGIRRDATPNASPSSERKLYKSKLQKRRSPYSQSLDMGSPPVRHQSSGKLLPRNLSSDNASEPTNKKTSSQRKHHQTPQSIKSTAELDKTLNCNTLMPLKANQSDDNKVTDDLIPADQEKSITQIMPQPLNIANQPNIKPVLEKICYSIKSIRQITQNKRPSCLEKSNSLPDFSSHVASTFGSSTTALLAFLSVMTLKEGLTNLNMDELNANNVSCAEALKMIDSLREIASIEDSHELRVSLSNLQQSASKQLLQSWKGFQDLSNKCKSRGSTPNNPEQECVTEASPEKDCDIDKNVIDEIVNHLYIPEKLKEELTSLSMGVKSDSEDEEKLEKAKPKDNRNISDFSKKDVNVRDVTQDEKANVDVSSIIKKFTDINQPKQRSMGSITKDSLYGQSGVAKCPPAEPIDKPIPEARQLYSSVIFAKDNEQQSHNEEQEKAKMNGVLSSKNRFEQDSRISEVEDRHIGGNQLRMPSEESMPENELTHDDESGSDEKGQNMLSAIKDLEPNASCKQSVSSSEAGEQHSSEESDVECEEIQQESKASDDLSNHESHSEEEGEKQPCSDYYVEGNVRGKERISSPDSQNKMSEVECQAGSLGPNVSVDKSTCNSDVEEPSSEEEQPEVDCQAGSIGPNVSVDESTCNSHVDEPFSEEEQPEVECKELKVFTEVSMSGNEVEEEEHLDDLSDHREQTKCKHTHISEETKSQNTVEGDLSNLIENQDLYTKKDNSSFIKSESLTKSYGFNADEDSGNEHSSCEEHAEVEQPKVEDEQTNSLHEEELSYGKKESSSVEEYANMDRYKEKSLTEDLKAPPVATQSKNTKCEKAVEKLKHQSEAIISQSVAERVILLEKQVANAQKTTESSATRRCSQKNAPLESDIEDSPSESPSSQSAPCTRSARQSSLSFSYDSCGVITTEPESNRVRSIRQMFLAKSATDIPHGPGRFPSQKISERSELRAETSASGGYQSLTSSELSSSEDDSARKSITKGFVRRTIERLYGKKEAKPDDEASERPSSAPKQKKKEHSSIFSHFHKAQSKAMSELSYFNSSNALDTLSEATHVAFNVQVRPEESVPINNDQWLLRENTLIRKSVSDPVGINKNLNSPQGEGMCEDTEENTYSLFSTKSELEDKKSSFSRKCTYFSLPHSSDSYTCQDDLSTVSKSSANYDSIVDTKDNSEDTKMWAERNGTLPCVGVIDFKMMDNKVHPLTEPPPVVVQPGKGQGVVRRIPEPDMLDILYNFCGQNCPIL
ncbi:oxygen-regulated protein 1 isoform X1 [Sander lucioperca]|uniref:oxygen-regulated protein 1 isoform X1 n=2 Tax=Sander lucioperca TaxID=283035 RepID=UPI00165385EB|nr:oxygen-regulated protein 1 isoform X1 [Sander lucioperca]